MALTIDQLQIQIVAESTQATQALDALIGRLKTVQNRLTSLGNSGKKTGQGFKEVASGANKATTAINKHKNAVDKTSKSTVSFTDKLAMQISKTRTLVGAFMSVARVMGSWFNESNEYIETLNLFNVTMGEAAPAAREYAKAVEAAMGIDSKEFMQNWGVFKNLTAGFGVVEEDANKMSQNLTQLSYDMASFFNADVETAFDKLSSAMSGQVKGLREYGIDTTVATLQEYALTQGITKKVSAMTQAEKAMLRYNYIMDKSIHMQGDMARTIITPANALRILQAQLTRMKRAFGDIISVLATQVIPYVQAFVEIITEAASKLAKFFGFSSDEFMADTSGLTNSWVDAEEGVDDYTDSLKKAKKQMMGFDELNIIQNPNSDSSAAGGAASGGLGDMELLEYDFLKGLKADKLDEVKAKMKDILDKAYLIGAAILGWKLGGFIKNLALAETKLTGFSKFLSGAGIALGATIAITGLVWMIDTGIDAWKNGLGVPEFGELMASAGITVGGAALLGLSLAKALGKPIGTMTGKFAGIALIATGIGMVIVAIKDLISNGPTLTNILTLLAGAVAIVVGVCLAWNAAMLANPITWIIIGIMALIAAIVLCIVYWDEIKAAAGACWEWIKGVWEGVSTWFNDNVIQPVVGFFVWLWEGIVTAAKACWYGIKTAFAAVGNWFNEKVVQPVAGFFTNLWEGIKNTFSSVGSWFGNIFTKAWEGIKKAFSAVGSFFTGVWNTITGVFSKVGNVIGGAISNAVGKAVNAVLSTAVVIINGFIDAINLAINLINKIPGVNIKTLKKLEVPKMADGGFVENTGQLFIAREAGPELVGNIGRKTAVANNDQIIAGIESGVYRAMVAANSSNHSGSTQTIRIINEIDGDIVGEKVIKYHNNRVMQTGASPLLV